MSEQEPHTIDVESEHDASGQVAAARIRFGPHYLVEVRRDEASVTFTLVATHHGFRADATQLGGELEQIINDVRHGRPGAAVD